MKEGTHLRNFKTDKNLNKQSWIHCHFSLISILTSGALIHLSIHPSMLFVPSKLSQIAYSLLRSANFWTNLWWCVFVAVWLAGCYDNVEPTTTIHTSLKPYFVSARFLFGLAGYLLFGIYRFLYSKRAFHKESFS